MRARTGAWSAILLAAGVAACADGRTDAGDDSLARWSVAPEPVVEVGETEGDAEYLFQLIGGALLLPDGGFVVMDRGLAAVRAYDADGTFRWEVGGQGDGPGEFRYLSSMSLRVPDTLEVYDSDHFRLTRLSTDGTLLSTTGFNADDGRPEIHLGRLPDGDRILAWIDQTSVTREPEAVPDPMRIGRFEEDGDFVSVLENTTGLRRASGIPIPFTPEFRGAVVGGVVYFTDGLRPELRALNPAGGLDTVPLPVSQPDPAESFRLLEAELEAREDTAALRRLETVSRADSVPAVAELFLDGQGRFWVKQYEPMKDSHWLGGWAGARGGVWWVVEPTGEAVARVQVPEGLIPLDVRDGTLLGLRRDELGVERVVLHGIREEEEEGG